MHHTPRRKQMEKRSYLIRHICGTAIATALFTETSLYRTISGSKRTDLLVLWALAAACCALGIMVTWRSRRRRELWFDVFAPSMIWILMSWLETIPIPVVCAALTVPVVHFVLPRRLYSDDERRAQPFRTRYLLFLRRLRRGGAGAIAAIIVFLGIRGFFFASSVQLPRASEREQITIQSSMHELVQLEPSRWMTLDTKQKLAVARTIADIEADAYGLPERLNVKMQNLPNGTRAEYMHYRRCVTLDRALLENEAPDEVLCCVLHECRHAYQHQLVRLYESADDQQKDLLIFQETDIPAIKDSFDSYVDGDRDYDRYFRQYCEEDARNWAESHCLTYLRAIQDYLEDAAAA